MKLCMKNCFVNIGKMVINVEIGRWVHGGSLYYSHDFCTSLTVSVTKFFLNTLLNKGNFQASPLSYYKFEITGINIRALTLLKKFFYQSSQTLELHFPKLSQPIFKFKGRVIGILQSHTCSSSSGNIKGSPGEGKEKVLGQEMKGWI